MRVVVFGASGMIGNGVLLECFEDPGVSRVLAIGRSPCSLRHPKLEEIVVDDLFDLSAVEARLADQDACLYCLGISSAGMSEAAYRRITLDLTVVVAESLRRVCPDVRVCFVSGQGTDGSERGRVMWARVKGAAENALLNGPLDAYVFRPGFIQPLKGVRSKTRLYQALYDVLRPVSPLLVRFFPGGVTTSVVLGKAMIRVAREGGARRVLETRDINEVGRAG